MEKQSTWDKQRAAGLMDSAQYEEIGFVECVDGIAEAVAGDKNNTFKCSNVRAYQIPFHPYPTNTRSGRPLPLSPPLRPRQRDW